MNFEQDPSFQPPGLLKRALARARLRAAFLLWPFLERMLHALLAAMHALSLREVAWITPARYFRVGRWFSFCSRASRRSHFDLWRAASKFPAPGFSQREAPKRRSALDLIVSEALNQADTPWFDPAARSDLLWALRARALMLAPHPARLFGAASTLDLIPPSERTLEAAFRSDLEELCPGWADIDVPASDMVGQRMLLDVDLRRSIERARTTQRSFLEARSMERHLPSSPETSGRSARL